MQEKLSIRKVYANACKYVSSHLTAFIFLTVFYFFGNSLPLFIGLSSFKLVMFIYYYLFYYIFLYFATGCFYKQQIILDGSVFCAAGLRFLTAVLLFLAAILISTFGINICISLIRNLFSSGTDFTNFVLQSTLWQIAKYLFIFLLIVIFFLIPSFAFVSEITGKHRSTLTAFAKAKGNVIRIAVVAMFAYLLILSVIGLCIFLKFNALAAEFIRDIAVVFVTIVYFKMYDFFYKIPKPKIKTKEIKIDNVVSDKEIKLADAGSSVKKVLTKNIALLKGKSVKPKGDEDVNQG